MHKSYSITSIDIFDGQIDLTLLTNDPKYNFLYDQSFAVGSGVFPILKTVEDIKGTDLGAKLFGHMWVRKIEGRFITYFHIPSHPDDILFMLSNSIGACEDVTSPTGYVDFITGLPCVTPKMVEEGIEL